MKITTHAMNQFISDVHKPRKIPKELEARSDRLVLSKFFCCRVDG